MFACSRQIAQMLRARRSLRTIASFIETTSACVCASALCVKEPRRAARQNEKRNEKKCEHCSAVLPRFTSRLRSTQGQLSALLSAQHSPLSSPARLSPCAVRLGDRERQNSREHEQRTWGNRRSMSLREFQRLCAPGRGWRQARLDENTLLHSQCSRRDNKRDRRDDKFAGDCSTATNTGH